MTTSHDATYLHDEIERLKRKVSFYIDLLNRTAQERDEALGGPDRRFLWVQQHPVTGLEIAQALYSTPGEALAEDASVTDPETWSLWEARPVPPEEVAFLGLLTAADDLDGGNDADRDLANNIRRAVTEVASEDTATPTWTAHEVTTKTDRGYTSAWCSTCGLVAGDFDEQWVQDRIDSHRADTTRPAGEES